MNWFYHLIYILGLIGFGLGTSGAILVAITLIRDRSYLKRCEREEKQASAALRTFNLPERLDLQEAAIAQIRACLDRREPERAQSLAKGMIVHVGRITRQGPMTFLDDWRVRKPAGMTDAAIIGGDGLPRVWGYTIAELQEMTRRPAEFERPEWYFAFPDLQEERDGEGWKES